jgi:Peptidase family M23
MKRVIKLCYILSFLLPFDLMAQKVEFRLSCPLNDAVVVPPPKNAIKYSEQDYCIVLVSKNSDTVVKAVYEGKVTNVEFTDETKNGVVIYSRINNKDYYFWYTGLNKLLVKRNDKINAGQGLGYISPGDQIELLMFQFETPVDPIKYLDCKGMN